MNITDLRCLNQREPLGIGSEPWFSWVMESKQRETIQMSYRLIVHTVGGVSVWDTGMVESWCNAYIPYAGTPLLSKAGYTWEVTVQDNHGNTAMAQSRYETGILLSEDWHAKWIVNPASAKKAKHGRPASLFRKVFTMEKPVARARAYATCHGVYSLTVNGRCVDNRELAPEFTVYEKELCVQTYDVTQLLTQGENVLGIEVADGWYSGSTTRQTFKGWDRRHACLWQLEIDYEDGTNKTVCSDTDCRVSTGLVTRSDLFHGEDWDANVEQPGWDAPGFSDTHWPNVVEVDFGYANLVPQDGEPVRAVMTIPAKSVLTTPKGEHVVDFGQNLAGRIRVKLDLSKGASVAFEHSETLDSDGNWFNNILGINQKDTFVSSGNPVVFEPQFTFHGFRYVRVTGIETPKAEDFEAVVLSTDAPWIGEFACSDEKINQLVENTRRSQRSNMLSIPTDCPQREKMGWTGDMTVYADTAMANQDLTCLLIRWLKSLTLTQMPDGQVPNVVPWPDFYRQVSKLTVLLLGGSLRDYSSSGWGDAAVAVPWALYQATGNTRVLAAQYQSMKAWVEYQRKQAETKRPKKDAQAEEIERYLWDTGFHFGEWLIPSATKHGSMSAAVRKSAKDGRRYIAPLYYLASTRTLAECAHILGYQLDAELNDGLASKVMDAIRKSLVLPDGRLRIESQGAYALALGMGVIPDALKKNAAARLAELIQENGGKLDTGFLATPYLLDALSDNGQAETAYALLRQNQMPSWMFEVEHGATTIWENWNAENAKGKTLKASHNHYAFGCVANWIYRKYGGIVPIEPGYTRFKIEPKPDISVIWGRHRLYSPFGWIGSEWRLEGGVFHIHAEIPCGSRAVVVLPDGACTEVGSGVYDYSCTL